MFVSHKLKLIFTHIPKTAGASLRSAIKRIDNKAEEIGQYHSRLTRTIKRQYPGYKTITIVRNSYQIVVSRYRFEQIVYQRKGKVLKRNFKQYITTKDLKVFNQLGYIFTRNGYRLVDFILHQERLNDDIKKMNKELGLKIPKIKQKLHYYGEYDYKSYYNKTTLDIVKQKCKKDIEYFDWKFED